MKCSFGHKYSSVYNSTLRSIDIAWDNFTVYTFYFIPAISFDLTHSLHGLLSIDFCRLSPIYKILALKLLWNKIVFSLFIRCVLTHLYNLYPILNHTKLTSTHDTVIALPLPRRHVSSVVSLLDFDLVQFQFEAQ